MKESYNYNLYHFIFLIGLAVFISTLIGVVRSYSPVPYWDQWDGYVDFYIRVMDGDLSAWWKQHNEHRIVFSRVLFWVDMKYFSGKSYFLLISNILLQCVNSLLLIYVYNKVYKSNEKIYLAIIGMVLTCLFAWGQHENFTWGFQSQFISVYTFSLLAIIFIVAIKNSYYKIWMLVFSCTFAFLASISMANGLLIFPLLIITTLVLRLPCLNLLTISFVGAITYIAYFSDYVSPPGHSSVVYSIMNYPIEVIEYLLLYIGTPFYILSGSKFIGQFFGGSLILFSSFFAMDYIKNGYKNPYKLVFIVFILFIGGTAVATAAGRINFGLGSALSSRYMTPAYLAWACFTILLIGYFKYNQKYTTLFAFSLTIVLLGTLIKQKVVFDDFSDMKFKRNMAISSLYSGASDDLYLREIYPSSERLLLVASKAIKRNLSVFDEKQFGLYSNFDINNAITTCSGSHEEFVAVDNLYYRVKGWSYKKEALPEGIIFADSEGKVVGTGIVGQTRPDLEFVANENVRNSGWQGYIPIKSGSVTAYAVYGDSFCKIPEGPFLTIKPNYIFSKGVNDTIVTRFIRIEDGGWIYGGIHPSIKEQDKEMVFGSWVSDDYFTGVATFKIPENVNFITLNYMTGPSNGGQFFSILGPDGFEFNKIQLPLSERDWSTIKIPTDNIKKGSVVELMDLGERWGQWSAYKIKMVDK